MFTLDNVSRIQDKIMIKLMGSQKLFKCLKYDSTDALSQPDLTKDEMLLLINQEGDTSKTRVSFTPFNLHLKDSARSDIRIFIKRFKPDNIHLTNVDLCIQIITQNSLCRLDNGDQRLLIMVSEMLNLLNGTDIGFVGNLYFEKDISLYPYGSFFTGYELYPTTRSV